MGQEVGGGTGGGWWDRRWVVGQVGHIAGVVGQEGDAREPDGAGEVGAGRARWLGREGWQGAGGPDGSCWGWWGQEGNGKEPDWAGAVGTRRASCWGGGVVGGWQRVGVQDGGSQ